MYIPFSAKQYKQWGSQHFFSTGQLPSETVSSTEQRWAIRSQLNYIVSSLVSRVLVTDVK